MNGLAEVPIALVPDVVEAYQNDPEFQPFPKIGRYSRDIIVTEKIDGTNAQILITEDGCILAGSRNRWLSPEKGKDNFGFAAWVRDHADELREGLGVGRHYGEWYGAGIQRGYGLPDKGFALFNVSRWADIEKSFVEEGQEYAPMCCMVVPILYRGPNDQREIQNAIGRLATYGSQLVKGYDQPEGIVICHTSNNALFKWTFDGDGHKNG